MYFGFIRQFVIKPPEEVGGWDFAQDNREASDFMFGGLSLEQDPAAEEYIGSTETPKTAATATLT